MVDSRIVILGAIFLVIGNAAYLADTVRGRSAPNRVSFALWTLVPIIAFAAEMQQSVGWAALATLWAGLGPGLILFASLLSRHGQWQLGRFDYICGALSLLAVALWRLTSEPNLAIGLSIAADFLACIPTFRKGFIDPGSETGSGYLFSGLSSVTGVLVARHFTFAAVAFNIWCVIACGTMTCLVLIPRKPRRVLDQAVA